MGTERGMVGVSVPEGMKMRTMVLVKSLRRRKRRKKKKDDGRDHPEIAAANKIRASLGLKPLKV